MVQTPDTTKVSRLDQKKQKALLRVLESLEVGVDRSSLCITRFLTVKRSFEQIQLPLLFLAGGRYNICFCSPTTAWLAACAASQFVSNLPLWISAEWSVSRSLVIIWLNTSLANLDESPGVGRYDMTSTYTNTSEHRPSYNHTLILYTYHILQNQNNHYSLYIHKPRQNTV